MIPKKYLCNFVLFYLTDVNVMEGYAQDVRVMGLGEIEIIPGATIRLDDSRGDWTNEMYLQWFDELRRKSNADGNLWKETDADNRIKTMTYDQFGRITKKVLPEFTTYYRYDGDGFLAADSSDNGAIRTFIYDTYGRLYKDRDSSPDSRWLEKTYAYSTGNVSSIQFDSNLGAIGTENYTYTNGHLSDFGSGGTLW